MNRTKLQRNNVTKRSSTYIGTLRNTSEGRAIASCLSTLLRPFGSVYKQGRNPNRKSLAKKYNLSHDRLRQNVPIKYSTRFDLYLNRKNWWELPRNNKGSFNMLDGIPPYWKLPLGLLQALVLVRKGQKVGGYKFEDLLKAA